MSSSYPDDWDDRRRRVYRRDNYTCQNCGVRGGSGPGAESVELHAHHIVPISKGGTHSTSNLKTLCVACHNAIHHKHAVAPTTRNEDHEQDGNAPTGQTAVFAITMIVLALWLGYEDGGIIQALLFFAIMALMFGLLYHRIR